MGGVKSSQASINTTTEKSVNLFTKGSDPKVQFTSSEDTAGEMSFAM